MRHHPRRSPRHGRPSARCRWWHDEPPGWVVHARVERFVEPALLLLLAEGEGHGYELAESLASLVPDERVDLGNLYRLLRGLEAEGLVRSRWRDDLPGRARRTYELTPEGRAVLSTWVDALQKASGTIASFIDRFEAGPGKDPRPS